MKQPENNVLDNLICAVFILDAEQRINYMNDSAASLIQCSQVRALNRFVTDFIQNEALHEHIERAFFDSELHVVRESELLIRGNGGVIVDCSVSPQMNENDETVGVLLEINRVDRQVRIAAENQLLQQQQASRALLRGLAHEIKNPLGGVRGAAQLLETELAQEELKEYTRIIISEADRLNDLIDQVSGSVKLPETANVNIHEVLEHVRSLVNSSLSDNITIKIDYDPSIPELKGDRNQLVQVILNIVNNAIQSLSKNQSGIEGNIILKTRIVRQFTIGKTRYPLVLKAEVVDDGQGIPESLRGKIFLPMITDNPQGSGLGLSIAQDLIGRHNGLIDCLSIPRDTRFRIFIPLDSF